ALADQEVEEGAEDRNFVVDCPRSDAPIVVLPGRFSAAGGLVVINVGPYDRLDERLLAQDAAHVIEDRGVAARTCCRKTYTASELGVSPRVRCACAAGLPTLRLAFAQRSASGASCLPTIQGNRSCRGHPRRNKCPPASWETNFQFPLRSRILLMIRTRFRTPLGTPWCRNSRLASVPIV